MNKKKYDFGGWATKNNLKCADGLIIRQGAFKVNDGTKVPLIWNHQHGDPDMVLGHALLKNRKEGVYAYCKFNGSEKAQNAKEAIANGDITSLSIWANNLVKDGCDVLHGAIREVSLVLAGANPGAFIESVVSHGMPMDEDDDEGIFYTGECICHSYDQHLSHADEEDDDDEESIADIYDSMSAKQKEAVAIMVGMALEDGDDDDEEDEEDEEDEDEEEDDNMRHNLFEDDYEEDGQGYLSHADMAMILDDAKKIGSLRESIQWHREEGVLAHADLDLEGMTLATGTQTYGFNDPSMLFPEYKNVNGAAPEWLSRNMDWVKKVMASVGRTPFSRIKSVFANITEDEARARGYIKGKMKKEEVFTTLKRTTDPQTVYKKQKLDRDDIIDITDFDVVAWIRAEMRVMLDEEIARAILIGDGRPADSDDKIQELHIRPIVNDVPLFNIKRTVTAGEKESDTAKNIIGEALRARKDYKGSGNPTLFTTEDYLTEMLLLEDGIGHRLYKTEQELATALRVSGIETVEPMENQSVDGKKLIGVIVNLADYRVGADKGGQINNFEDFDIDYNQHKYLIETRISGALVKPFSAITLLLDTGAGRMAAPRRNDD